MNNGSTTYLEVLTAQESLLSAQLTQVENQYEMVRALISLYTALGGFGK
jgi:outer membrane protein TolC